ncbi:MAG: Mur ligase domain-containing protein [Dehalococcoidia bacterium]
MRLGDLLQAAPDLRLAGDADSEVTGITYDSRRVRPGAVFVAIAGFTVDGRRFVNDAHGRGAAAVVVEGAVGPPADWDTRRCAWIAQRTAGGRCLPWRRNGTAGRRSR